MAVKQIENIIYLPEDASWNFKTIVLKIPYSSKKLQVQFRVKYARRGADKNSNK